MPADLAADRSRAYAEFRKLAKRAPFDRVPKNAAASDHSRSGGVAPSLEAFHHRQMNKALT